MSVGIVGLGISGLQLALFLQQGGLATTLYSPCPATALASGPIPNFVTRGAPTLQRERALGVVDPDARPNGRLRIRLAAQPELVVEEKCSGSPTPPTSGSTCRFCWTHTWQPWGNPPGRSLRARTSSESD